MRLLTGLLGLVLLIGASLPSQAESRKVALVIGNAAYVHAPPLTTSDNDGRTFATTLRGLGFEVLEGINVDHAGMQELIREFARALRGADVAVFYFSGHGLQADGENYLLPVDARLSGPADLDSQVIKLNLVLSQMGREPRTNLAFLDASRESPFVRTLAAQGGPAQSAEFVRGLARVIGGLETLIACAAQPDTVVPDETGATSRFTTAVLNVIATPNLEVREAITRARQRVIDETGGQQVPWVSSSLTRTFTFVPAEPEQAQTPTQPAAAPPPAAPPPPTVQGDTAEIVFWQSIQNSTDRADLEAYLRRYPDGLFADLARNRLNRLPVETAAAAPDAAAADPAAVEARLALTSSQRREIQQALTALGFNTFGIDGVIGPKTRAAITRYQMARADTATGYLTADLVQALLDEASGDRALRPASVGAGR